MYDMIKCATGWCAGFSTFGYGIVALVAIFDGHGGVEIPPSIAIPAMTGIILLALTSILMRLAERIERRVIESLASDHFDLLAAVFDHKLKANNTQLQNIIESTVSVELAAAVDEIKTQMFRAAVVSQASAAAAAPANAEATVMSMPSRNGRL